MTIESRVNLLGSPHTGTCLRQCTVSQQAVYSEPAGRQAGTMWVLIILAVIRMSSAIPDPCLSGNHVELNEPHRSEGYVLGPTDLALCDNHLQTGWYRFNSLAGGKMPEHCVQRFRCGTHAPIWLNGSHPDVTEGMVDREVCANFGGAGPHPDRTCCDTSLHVGVKNCGHFYVYYLRPTLSCPNAYCAGHKVPCGTGQHSNTGFAPCVDIPARPPQLVGPEVVGQTFRFTCQADFTHRADVDQALEVVWTFDGQEDHTIPHSVITGQHGSAELPGTALKDHMGTDVGCKIRSILVSNTTVTSEWVPSNTYWAGIRTGPNILEVSEKGTPGNVTVTSTVPLVCDHDRLCCLMLSLDVNGPRNNLAVPTTCDYNLCSKDWDPTTHTASVTVPVLATRDHVRDGDKTLMVGFSPLLSVAGGPYLGVFNGYRVDPVKVIATDETTSTCTAVGDPHIHGMEDYRTFNLFEVGDYTMYENPARNFEVQARTWRCGGSLTHYVTCICGVAIREGDELIRVDQCRQRLGDIHTSPTVTSARPLGSRTRVMRSRCGNHIKVGLASGFEMLISATPHNIDTHLLVPSVDNGEARGVCGTFDGNRHNEYTHRGGYVQHVFQPQPVHFTQSWSNRPNSSLFETTPPAVGPGHEPQYCVCGSTRGGQPAADCTGHPETPTQRIPCPGLCHDVTSNVPPFLQTGNNWSRRDVDALYRDVDEEDPVYDLQQSLADATEQRRRRRRRELEPQWPTPSGITEQQARSACSSQIQSSQLWASCQHNDKVKDASLQDCLVDVLYTDSFEFMESAMASFTIECQMDLGNDPDNYVTSADGKNVLKPEISSDLCSVTCFRHGRCQQGKCICDSGFTGDNCQLLAGKGPQLYRIRGSNICDINQRPCRKVYFDASNFEMSDTFHCAVYEVLSDGSLSPAPHIEAAELVTSGRLACHLPETGVQKDRSVVTLAVSVTSDGDLYSNYLNFTVFDSSCRDCDLDLCPQKPGTCLINDLCHQDWDLHPDHPHLQCRVHNSTTQWTRVDLTGQPDFGQPKVEVVSADILRCTFPGDASPDARYQVDWLINGDVIRTREVTTGRPGLDLRTADLPTYGETVPVQCAVSAYYYGQTTPQDADRKLSPVQSIYL